MCFLLGWLLRLDGSLLHVGRVPGLLAVIIIEVIVVVDRALGVSVDNCVHGNYCRVSDMNQAWNYLNALLVYNAVAVSVLQNPDTPCGVVMAALAYNSLPCPARANEDAEYYCDDEAYSQPPTSAMHYSIVIHTFLP